MRIIMIVCKSCDGLTLNWKHCDYCRWYVWHDYSLPSWFWASNFYFHTTDFRLEKSEVSSSSINALNGRGIKWFGAVTCRAVNRDWHFRCDRHKKMSETHSSFQPPSNNEKFKIKRRVISVQSWIFELIFFKIPIFIQKFWF